MRPLPLKWTVPAVLAAGSGALILLQARLPAGPRYAPFAMLRPIAELRGGDGEAERLRRENGELLAALLAEQQKAGALQEKLRSVSDYRESGIAGLPPVLNAAVILTEDASGWHGTVLIDKGSRHGVKPGMNVAEGACVVGRVLEAGDSTSRVRLVTDAQFKMKCAAVQKGSGAAPVTAMLFGNGDGTCRLEFVLDREPVAPGWIVTSVNDPDRGWVAGMIVGEVVKGGEAEGVYGEFVVKPRVEADRLRHVLVLLGK